MNREPQAKVRVGRRAGRGPAGLRKDAPGISGGLERGRTVKIPARIGNDLVGYFCDRDAAGLLLDARHLSGVHAGYELYPGTA